MTGREFEIIDRFFRPISNDSPDQVILGPGDDCAVLTVPADRQLCVSTDTLIEGVHFPVDASADVVAQRTMAANLSDLAAMGAEPHAFVLAMTLPSVDERWLGDFSERLSRLASRYAIPLVGGNLSRGPLSLTMTVMGVVPVQGAVLRSGAMPGDDLYVSGTPGDAAHGLAKYQSDERTGYLVERYLSPTPRIESGEALRAIVSAMIDVSDGLIADLGHLTDASGVGAVLNLEDLPVSDELLDDAGRELAIDLVLAGGDDYELCFSAPPERAGDIAELASTLSVPLTRIGQTDAKAGIRLIDGGIVVNRSLSGYEHF